MVGGTGHHHCRAHGRCSAGSCGRYKMQDYLSCIALLSAVEDWKDLKRAKTYGLHLYVWVRGCNKIAKARHHEGSEADVFRMEGSHCAVKDERKMLERLFKVG